MTAVAMSRVLFAAVVLCSTLPAQNPLDLFEKAPPAVDEALRARIEKFYQAHVDGKFRIADQVVAEDSKDFFFAANKSRCNKFEIVKVGYSDNFTRARATVTCHRVVAMFGAGAREMPVAVASTWKLEGGEWWWYITQEDFEMTPFGRMKEGEGKAGGSLPFSSAPNPQAILSLVQIDKPTVELTSAATDRVTVSNGMPGSISLSLDPPESPGLRMKLSESELQAGEKAEITFERLPDAPAKGRATIRVLVKPTGQTLPIEVRWSVTAR